MLAIIDSGGANIASVQFALQRLGCEAEFTADAERIRAADRVILPGVGAAGSAMAQLRRHDLVGCIRQLQQPVLGICLGMQLLFEHSAEDQTDCLGVLPGRLEKLPPQAGLRVPHMGWNQTNTLREDPLFAALPAQPWFYFVHSYYAPLSGHTVASCRHAVAFSAVVRKDNFTGVQFHPERSAGDGAQMLKNFLEDTWT